MTQDTEYVLVPKEPTAEMLDLIMTLEERDRLNARPSPSTAGIVRAMNAWEKIIALSARPQPVAEELVRLLDRYVEEFNRDRQIDDRVSVGEYEFAKGFVEELRARLSPSVETQVVRFVRVTREDIAKLSLGEKVELSQNVICLPDRAPGVEATPSNRDNDWVLAMATALGPDSGFKVPIVPKVETFKELFAALRQPSPVAPSVPYLCKATRFKMAFRKDGSVTCFANFETELDGKWVALVEAADDMHMRYAAPPVAEAKVVEFTGKMIEIGNLEDGGRGIVLEVNGEHVRLDGLSEDECRRLAYLFCEQTTIKIEALHTAQGKLKNGARTSKNCIPCPPTREAKVMKPLDKICALKSDTAVGRIDYCRMMLLLHGFLSEAENEKVMHRINKWVLIHAQSRDEGAGEKA